MDFTPVLRNPRDFLSLSWMTDVSVARSDVTSDLLEAASIL